MAASLAESGYCKEALPSLAPAAGRAQSKDFQRAMEVVGLRCAMAMNATNDALGFLRLLNRDSPDDPEILYMKKHAYSDLSLRASQDLIMRAPGSYQTHLLNAESLEIQGQWEQAAAEYRKVLEKDPKARGVHYRLGRLLLSMPKTATSTQEARHEFEEELKIDPDHPGAEFVLGELARQDSDWPTAIAHFSRAARLDPAFADAHLGLARGAHCGRAVRGGGGAAGASRAAPAGQSGGALPARDRVPGDGAEGGFRAGIGAAPADDGEGAAGEEGAGGRS